MAFCCQPPSHGAKRAAAAKDGSCGTRRGHERNARGLVFVFDIMENTAVPTREAKQWQHYKADKTMRLARKEIKRNRKPDKGGRSREQIPDRWDGVRGDEADEFETPQVERVMPRGERERRRKVLTTALARLEEQDDAPDEPMPEETAARHGVVIEVSSSLCRVSLDGRTLLCGLRGSLSAHDTGFTNVVAVGDRVLVSSRTDRGGAWWKPSCLARAPWPGPTCSVATCSR